MERSGFAKAPIYALRLQAFASGYGLTNRRGESPWRDRYAKFAQVIRPTTPDFPCISPFLWHLCLDARGVPGLGDSSRIPIGSGRCSPATEGGSPMLQSKDGEGVRATHPRWEPLAVPRGGKAFVCGSGLSPGPG